MFGPASSTYRTLVTVLAVVGLIWLMMELLLRGVSRHLGDRLAWPRVGVPLAGAALAGSVLAPIALFLE